MARNNIQNDVKVERSQNYISKFDLGGVLSTTANIGEVSVAFSRLLQPGTKAMFGAEQCIRMAPLLGPTYTKMFYKNWHNFIPIEDIFPNYSAYMTKQPISRNNQVFVPTKKPHAPANMIASFVLYGAKATIYVRPLASSNILDSGAVNGGYVVSPLQGLTSSTQWYQDVVDYVVNGTGPDLFNYTKASDGSPWFNPGYLFNIVDDGGSVVPYSFPSGNWREDTDTSDLYYGTNNSFCLPFTTQPAGISQMYGYDVEVPVPLGDADFVRFSQELVGTKFYEVAIAFRFSSFGTHIHKILTGLGYGIDLDDVTPKSILPLVAAYKSYWDVFGLNQFMNFESSSCGQLIAKYTCDASPDIASSAYRQMFVEFMRDLGSMFVTERRDYISAHLPQPVISPAIDAPLYGVVDVVDASGGVPSSPARDITVLSGREDPITGHPSDQLKDGHASTRTQFHGALDSEILKRLYKMTNRNTALGRKIADLMRSQGLGQYMERTRVNYIGDTIVPLDVSAVTSTSDTYESASGDGQQLGAYGGKGVGYKANDKKLFYKTDCLGYWIALDAVTCDAGYAQGVDLTLNAIEQIQDYQPEFDGLGLQLDSKAVINGSRDISTSSSAYTPLNPFNESAAASPFGFIPRYSEYKVGRNCMSGGFAKKSTRKDFWFYNMDKLVYPDDIQAPAYAVTLAHGSMPQYGKSYEVMRSLPVKDIPIAGDAWRFLGRYHWLANFARIFSDLGQQRAYTTYSTSVNPNLAKYFEYCYLQDDNFIILQDCWFKAWSGMLPIEETYGTVDPDRKELEYVERV